MTPRLRVRLASFLAVALAVAAVPTLVRAIPPEEAAQGREALKRHADAVVNVEMVVTLRGSLDGKPMPTREEKADVNATVISPAGLTVLSLGAIDPRARITRPGAHLEEPEFKEVKIQLADGTEFPAQVVFKDEDLDLAFVLPDEPADGGARPVFAHVDLTDAATPEILGTYFDIARASKKVQRTPAVRVITVIGIVEGPRRFLLASEYSMGCPVFDGQGRVLGITFRHIVDSKQVGLAIVPAADVLEMAPKQP